MIKHFAALGLTTFIRLLTGFVLFVLIAREWGAAAFGEFMYVFAIASLLVLACEFGFSQQILKDVGQHPQKVQTAVGEYLSAKLYLTGATWVIALAYVFVVGMGIHQSLMLGLLLLAATFMSYSDFLMAFFRAIGIYKKETEVTLYGNVIYFGLSIVALQTTNDPVWVGVAMALGRAMHLGVTLIFVIRHFPANTKFSASPKHALDVIRNGIAYGLDVGVATAFVNLDTVLITLVLGYESAGLYQASARFYQGAALLPPIFAGVFLPKMAHVSMQPAALTRLANKLYWSTFAASIIVATVFLAAPLYYSLIYPDPAMKPVGVLLPWFGLLVAVRFVAAAQGITVTALGGQSVRAKLFLAALLLMMLASLPLMKQFGAIGMIQAITLAYAGLAIGFWLWIERQKVYTRSYMLASTIGLACMAFIVSKY